MATRRPRSRRRPSLRQRLALAFGACLLLVTGVPALVTWDLATGYMVAQRERSVAAQAEVNARLVDGSLRTQSRNLGELLAGLTTDTDSTVLLRRGNGWLTGGRAITASELPTTFLDAAASSPVPPVRLVVRGLPVLAVGRPVADGGTFVQLFPLSELLRTFDFLGAVLVSGVGASVLLGVALGWWTGRRALRPLTELTDAAARVAGGDLRARLPDQDDPDLTPLAGTFNRTAEALETRVRRDERFAADVSHELRSPLTTMANAAAVLHRRRAELSDTARRALELLVSEVETFRRTVVDLLEISRDEQVGALGPDEQETIDLPELVGFVLEHRGAAHLADPAPGRRPLVRGDRRRLDRVLANLLDNADVHGGGAVRVAVCAHGGRARIEVDDAGTGVPESQRGTIFERFARGAGAQRRGGSGLGLSLVAQHVRRHGGSVHVEDRPGGGARFVVELPEAPG